MKAIFTSSWAGVAVAVTSCLSAGAKADELAVAQAAFAEADKALNTLWKTLKSESTPERFAQLQKAQREWLLHRDYVADFQMSGDRREDPSKRTKDTGYLQTAAYLTEARIAFLRTWNEASPETLTGTWTDSFGGRLELVERDRILYFQISCVRGPTFHTGELAGIARTNGRIARFSDRASDPEKVEEFGETWLTFLQSGDGTLKVIGANTTHYHGVRAFFDGEYRHTSALDDTRREEIVKLATAPKAE